MRDDSRKEALTGWAKRHNEVMIKIHDLLHYRLPDALDEREQRISDRTDESHVQYIQTVHDRLADIVAEVEKSS